MAESQSPITRLSNDDKCMLTEINAALQRAGVRQSEQETLLLLVDQTGEVSFSAAVQEGHRQMRESGRITATQCRVANSSPAR